MKHYKTNLAVSLALLLAAVSSIAAAKEPAFKSLESEIAELNSMLRQKGAKWTAAETPLSRLSPEELQLRVGTSEMSITTREIPDQPGIASALPANLDWRDHGGNFVSAVKDQGHCGSCWAFAMTAGLEANALLRGAASRYADLSEQVLISCGEVGSCKGGRLNADFLMKTGLPPEQYYPYTASNGQCSAAGADWKEATYKIGTWGSVSRRLDSIKAALAKYGPLPTSFLVFSDFKHYKSGIYSHASGLSDIFKFLGGHAVLLVGYNDAEQYFIVKNSWGPDWGEGGYFRVAYSELHNDTLFGKSTIAYQPADPAQLPGLVRSGTGESVVKDISRKIEPLLGQRP